ncbi:MAG: tetratricopeptide repeat protein [Thermoanaerobaculia bacterium]|nr:tetratricopeptide repeat protein [Thermoanaerobaculia bacterium]
MGSAYRAVADLERSEESFNVALAFLEDEALAPYQDPLARARLAQRAAYLRCDQQRFPEALELVDEAIALLQNLEASHALGIALIDRAVITGRSGDPAKALSFLEQALGQLHPQSHPYGYLAAAHNMAVYLFELAQTPEDHQETLVWQRLVADLHARHPRGFDLLKLQVLLGLTLVRAGQVDGGIAELWAAQKGFGEMDAFYDQAIALLYLASIYLALNRPDQVKRLAGQLFPIFRHLAIDRETTAALMLFYNAAQAESASTELVAQVTAEVESSAGGPPHLS